MLCSRSFPQLKAIFNEYQFLTGHDIDDAIKAEFSGDLEKALRAIGKLKIPNSVSRYVIARTLYKVIPCVTVIHINIY